MRIAIAGASGFIGSAIVDELSRGGHTVVSIGRARSSAPPDIVWNPARKQLEPSALEGCDAVVNLAGANIGQRWTESHKREILSSRVDSTSLLSTTMAVLSQTPRLFISASAVGFYGDTGDRRVDEYNPRGSGFLADVVAAWEGAADPARQAGIRVLHPRFGVVLSPKGGALPKMLLPFKLGAGGKVGSGKQWMSWIALTDAARAVRFLLESPPLAGPVNVTSPSPVRNEELTQALARALGRPALLTVPEFAIKLAFGEMGMETLLAGQQAIPRRLMAAAFKFELAGINDALKAELSLA
ncbi:MAG: TIGR01777 family oxidoreductase [Gemmatimonadaceae bacterium]